MQPGSAAAPEAVEVSNNVTSSTGQGVCPHDLTGEALEEYRAKAWELFGQTSRRGTIPTNRIFEIAAALNLEAEEQTLHLVVASKEKEKLKKSAADDAEGDGDLAQNSNDCRWEYQEVLDIFDFVSQNESQRYGDLENDKDRSANKVFLSPLQYFWRSVCGTKDTQQQQQDYELDPKYSIELRPTTALLLMTSTFLFTVSFALLVLIGLLWRQNRLNLEFEFQYNLRNTLYEFTIATEVESFNRRHQSLQNIVNSITSLANFASKYDQERGGRRRHRLMDRIFATTKNYPSTGLLSCESVQQLGATGTTTFFNESTLSHALWKTLPSGSLFETSRLHTGSGAGEVGSNLTALRVLCDKRTVRNSESSVSFLVPYYNASFTKTDYLCFAAEDKSTDIRIEVVSNLLESLYTRDNSLAEGLISYFLVQKASRAAGVFAASDFSPVSPTSRRGCTDSDGNALCVELYRALHAGNMSGTAKAIGGLSADYNAVPVLDPNVHARFNVFLVVSRPLTDIMADSRSLIVDMISRVNTALGNASSIEFGAGFVDSATGIFNPQVTPPRFREGCYAACVRVEASQRVIKSSYFSKGPSIDIAPDYRPEPCAAAANFVPNADVTILAEQDVAEVRRLTLSAITEILKAVSVAFGEGIELEVFRYNDQPVMPTYDPRKPCPAGEECEMDPQNRVMIQYACIDCARYIAPSTREVKFLSTPKKRGVPRETTPLYRETLDREMAQDTVMFTDYKGDAVVGYTFYIKNLSTGVLLKTDVSWYMDSLSYDILSTLGICLAFLATGLVFLTVLAGRALGEINTNWNQSKQAIETARKKFGDMVSELIPPALAEKMLGSSAAFVSETSNSSAAFVDICSFSSQCQGLFPKQILRLIAYSFSVLEAVAEDCQMIRVSSVGDTFIAIAQQIAEAQGAWSHPAMRSAKFASVSILLFSPQYAHYPERLVYFRDAFKERLQKRNEELAVYQSKTRQTFEPAAAMSDSAFGSERGVLTPNSIDGMSELSSMNFESHLAVTGGITPFPLPPIRCGGHFGVFVTGVLDTGRTPKFDAFGSSMSLAARMCATSQPFCMHVTSTMHDILHSTMESAKIATFEFDAPRKTIVRGQGTVTSYFLRSSSVEVPENLQLKLGVERARKFFTMSGDAHEKGSKQGSNNSSSAASEAQATS